MTSDDVRARYLSAMGIDVYVRRELVKSARAPVPAAVADAPRPGLSRDQLVAAPAAAQVAPGAAEPSRPSPLEHDMSLPDDPSGASSAGPAAGEGIDVESELTRLAARVSNCEDCALCSTRTRTVFGVGNPSARIMVIGEGPGAEEDRRGEPFVGRAGKLLDAMLRAMGTPRESVYIANIVKCRPPNNRDPKPDEVAACASYLRRQIELVAPEVIMAVGRIAAQNLLGSDLALGKLRVAKHVYPPGSAAAPAGGAIPVVVTYHPAYLLRSPLQKRQSWVDLKNVLAVLNGNTG